MGWMRAWCLAVTLSVVGAADVRTVRVPGAGVQPQVVASGGVVHLVYLDGDPARADVRYARSTDDARTFSSPVRVNSEAGSAVAVGTIRGAHLAAGRGGRVHVAWNGNGQAGMSYARSDGKGGFEPQRNLMRKTSGLDGGGSVAADAEGHVYVAWHGRAEGAVKGETGRRVWVARSDDDGQTFAAEQPADEPLGGACACCGLRAFADPAGPVYLLYRSAGEEIHRDIHLLVSRDLGKSFRGGLVHPWQINACPMSSMTLSAARGDLLAAWETAGQVYWGAVDANRTAVASPIAAPGEGKGRKHPVVARNQQGETILVWTEGTGWQKGGGLAWQIYDRAGQPAGAKGSAPGVPVWGLAAVLARADGGFTIVY